MKDVKSVLVIVGGAIGAGFISGAELVRFFYAKTFLLAAVCSACLFAMFSYFFLRIGKRYGGYGGATDARFGRAAKGVRLAIALCSLIPCAGMLAGLDSLCPALSPLFSLTGLLFSLLVLRRGMKGISLLNLVLVPVLVLFVVLQAAAGTAFSFPTMRHNFLGGILYAGMNALLLAPVLMETGKETAHPLGVSVAAGAIVAAASVAVLAAVAGGGREAAEAEMPFLYVMKGKKIFPPMVALAIFTSLVSSLYALLGVSRGLGGKKKYAVKGSLLLTAFLLSRLGLKGIVGVFYPLQGALGLLFSVVCILDKGFFEKYHEKIHSRRQHAEDGRRAHHEVELEDLSAIHDEIPEPRP